MSMAQAASLLGQLPTPTSTNNRNLLGSLCSMPLYNMEQALVGEIFDQFDHFVFELSSYRFNYVII